MQLDRLLFISESSQIRSDSFKFWDNWTLGLTDSGSQGASLVSSAEHR
jgi:hypothetical protein